MDTTTGPLISEYADDPEMGELVLFFCSELPNRIQAVQEALSNADLGQLRTLSHQLKGAAPGYGFPLVGAAAAELEGLLRDRVEPDLESVRAAADQLVALCRRAVA